MVHLLVGLVAHPNVDNKQTKKPETAKYFFLEARLPKVTAGPESSCSRTTDMGGKNNNKSKGSEPVVPGIGVLPPKPPAPKPDPKDFCFMKRRGEVFVKRPGQINGAQLLTVALLL